MVHTKLAAAGIEVSVGAVAGIMAENGWAVKRIRATIPSDPNKVFADLIGRASLQKHLERAWSETSPTCPGCGQAADFGASDWCVNANRK
jgi:hypothetical protein